MDKNIMSVFRDTYLFRGISESELLSILNDTFFHIRSFQKNEAVPYFRSVGIIVSGEIKVFSEGKSTVLNILTEKMIFGVSSLFSEEKEVSEIICTKSAKIVFFGEEEFGKLLSYPAVRKNLISFMTGRIRFLNKKISAFSQVSAEKKLAFFLSDNENGGKVTTKFSYSELALSLGIGRASLYRVFDSFEKEGIIKHTKNEIIISDGKKLSAIINGDE